MKKLLNVSLFAMLATAPLAAMAETPTNDATRMPVPVQEVALDEGTHVASTNYVIGAYNALGGAVNKVQDNLNDVTAGTTNITFDNTDSELEATTVKGAIDEVDSRLDLLEDGRTVEGSASYKVKTEAKEADYTNSSMTGITTIGGAITKLDTRTDDLEAAVIRLDGADTVPTSVSYKVKNDSEKAVYTNSQSGLTATTIKGAIDEVDGRLDTLEANSVTAGSVDYKVKNDAVKGDYSYSATYAVGSIGKAMQDLTDNTNTNIGDLDNLTTDAKNNIVSAINEVDAHVDTLNAGDNVETSVSYKVKNDSEKAVYTNSQSGLTATTIKGAIDEVDSRLDLLQDARTVTGSASNKVKTEAKDADYDNSTSELTADTIQEAIDEVEDRVDVLEAKKILVYTTWGSTATGKADAIVNPDANN